MTKCLIIHLKPILWSLMHNFHLQSFWRRRSWSRTRNSTTTTTPSHNTVSLSNVLEAKIGKLVRVKHLIWAMSRENLTPGLLWGKQWKIAIQLLCWKGFPVLKVSLRTPTSSKGTHFIRWYKFDLRFIYVPLKVHYPPHQPDKGEMTLNQMAPSPQPMP